MNIVLYGHGGSKNHGCEAIVRSTLGILQHNNAHFTLISNNPNEDIEYGVNQLCEVVQTRMPYPIISWSFAKAYLHAKLTHDYLPQEELNYKKAFDHVGDGGGIALSIGGDNYCYGEEHLYILMHDMMLQRKAKTVLWGCSIEPDLLNKSAVAEDIARYSLITARESISYEALRSINPNTILVPDPAFTLSCHVPDLPEGFEEGNMVGINLSPLVIDRESSPGMAIANYRKLIEYVLEETSMGVALIPHVIWNSNDDRIPLQELYQEYSHSGRVVLIEDNTCTGLKGIISRCRFFVCARTHASIAAYSTGVPTLVVGYSVKARGIARDLLGTEDGYVLPVQQLETEDELTRAFAHMYKNEYAIRTHLSEILPQYIANVYESRKALSID